MISKELNVPKKLLLKLKKNEHVPNLIYVIDAEYIRNNLKVSFVGGGHSFCDDFINPNEIWLEECSGKSCLLFFAMHEYVENCLMKFGENYEHAHNFANQFEKEIRNCKNDEEVKKIFKNNKKILKESTNYIFTIYNLLKNKLK